jgi:hypothetical protein
MRHLVKQFWVILLTGMLVLGIGLQGLPAPCQNGHCGSGGCATSATPCPSSCTCHWSHGDGGDACCDTAGASQTAHGGHGSPAPHAHGSPAHTDAVTGAHGDHPPATTHADHAAASAPTGHDGHGQVASGAHCAPDVPAADDGWPNLSLPSVQPPAALAVAVSLTIVTDPGRPVAFHPALTSRTTSPPIRPPAA